MKKKLLSFCYKNIYISNKLQKLNSQRIAYFKNVEPLGRNIQKILGQFLTTQKLRGNRSQIIEIRSQVVGIGCREKWLLPGT